MLTGNPVCVPVCVCVLPDVDSSSEEDELSLCCMCRVLKAEPFPLGTASAEEERWGKEGKDISVSLLSDLGLCMSTG